MNDRIDEETSDFSAFREWLEETAAREDSSPGSILNQLMSTYWILTELSSVIDETPYGEDVATTPEEVREPEDGDHEAIIEVIESIAEMHTGQQPQPPQSSSGAVDPGIIRLVEALRADPEGESPRSDGASQYRLEKLQDELGELSNELEERSSSIGEDVSRQADRVDRLAHEIDEIETAMVDVDTFAAFETDVDDRHDDLQHNLAEAEDRFEDAYASIKQILEYLLNTTEQNQERIETTVGALETACADIDRITRNVDRLGALKREADRQGVVTPTCDNCGYTMDLALLTEPRCVECERVITGFETKRHLVRTSYVATTRADRYDESEKSAVVADLQQELERIDASERDAAVEEQLK